MADRTITIEDATVFYKNFSGLESDFNQAGARNFAVALDEEQAAVLTKDGWNVKQRNTEEGEPPAFYLPVAVGYKYRPPHIVQITSRGETKITEAEVGSLDWVEFKLVDLIIQPYDWEVGTKRGIKAYLKTMYVTLEEDFLDLKYSSKSNND